MDDVSDDEETDDTEKALRKATRAALEDDELGIELEVTGDLSEVKKVRVPHCSGRDTVYQAFYVDMSCCSCARSAERSLLRHRVVHNSTRSRSQLTVQPRFQDLRRNSAS